ncbi:hypothetical protein ARHIZOSPH14_28190 [Agromyces rhizosphaerae]|uniref:AMP-binding protein n=1 Tax=Agromyces rhizosphaerae TaxID=88374 RepID=A0A9W6FSB6_9MICO|nr:AMP-binding protein [Agromyces rhizosphaerae]GLI28577.1 hypothetical protein ARHIZOSPH14_28190 [Agromyces rhizosphaerae]
MEAGRAGSTTDRPWLGSYPDRVDPEPVPEHATIVDAWRARVDADPDDIAIHYFDGVLTAGEVDRASDALAAAMQDRDVRAGDRVGIYLQNIPYYPITLLALWKIGAVAVPLNPMYRRAELRRLVDDAGIVGIVAAPVEADDLLATLEASTVGWVLSASDRDFQTTDDARVLAPLPATPLPDGDVGELIRRHDGRTPSPVALRGDDLAFITYTSGTTGPPKGALNSHRNFLHAAMNYATWVALAPGDVVLAIAPLFHITGLTLNAGIALLNRTALVLTARYEPGVIVQAIADHAVTFTIGSITAFNAMLTVPWATGRHFRSVRTFFSGGAPIPPATIATFQERFGPYLHNVWGMTETTGGGIAVPSGRLAPVDPSSGTLSIGVPMQNVAVRIVDEHGDPVPAGTEGELEFDAPQVVSGYWNKPDATASTFPGGRLRTGDVAIMDDDGWIYLVDRLKDLINASGFKVWPREVEDVLYAHPAVFEAAVVGEPDEYRGETVVAYVSLAPGSRVEPEELIAFSRERLAAYKYPRKVYVVDAIPKTATGKIQRGTVRAGTAAARPGTASDTRGAHT